MNFKKFLNYFETGFVFGFGIGIVLGMFGGFIGIMWVISEPIK